MSPPQFPDYDHNAATDPEDDLPLVSFLQAHAPPIPEPPAKLEARLMQQIQAADPQELAAATTPLSRFQQARTGRLSWWIGGGVVLLMGLGLWVKSWMGPPSYSPAELTALDDYLSASWQDLGEPSEPLEEWDWFNDPQLADPPVQAATVEAQP